MKKYVFLVICLLVVIVADRGWAAPYRILHKDGAIYDSVSGWITTSPPYYPGTAWAVDFLYNSQGVNVLHRDGAVWNELYGWNVNAPPYYPGTDYARALDYTTIYGYSSATSGENYGVYGQSDSTSGYGVYGWASNTSGSNYGVYGLANGTGGRGVYGWASDTSGYNHGVYGQSSSTNGRGVFGLASNTSGSNYGVYGQSVSTSGRGVIGQADATSGTNYGVYGQSASTDGRGVYGSAAASSGTNYGVYGQSASTSGYGVYGLGMTRGVYGQSVSTSGFGVGGRATATSGTTYGVLGGSDSTSGYDFYASGSGTNYGPFTGAHEAKLAEDFPPKVEPGLIVVATGKAQRRQNADGTVNLSSTLPTIKLADQPHDKAVFGVLVAEATLPEDHWYKAQEGERFATVNALGEGRVWVTDGNGAIEAGDYITTSAIPGYGQRQDDDLVHSYTLGKAIETVDWDTVTKTVKINGKTFKVYLLAVVYTSG